MRAFLGRTNLIKTDDLKGSVKPYVFLNRPVKFLSSVSKPTKLTRGSKSDGVDIGSLWFLLPPLLTKSSAARFVMAVFHLIFNSIINVARQICICVCLAHAGFFVLGLARFLRDFHLRVWFLVFNRGFFQLLLCGLAVEIQNPR